jgi:hypothetical protein
MDGPKVASVVKFGLFDVCGEAGREGHGQPIVALDALLFLFETGLIFACQVQPDLRHFQEDGSELFVLGGMCDF